MGTLELVTLIERRCRDLNLAESQFSRAVTGHGSLVADLRRGRSPSAERLEQICDALGFEFYVGPPRDPPPQAAGNLGLSPASLADLERATRGLVRLTADAGGDPLPDDLWPVLAARKGGAATAAENGDLPPGARPVDVVELAAAAGSGVETLGEEVAGCVWFRHDWLDGHGLDPAQCMVIRVSGESMEPLLREGDSILVDRRPQGRQEGRVFVVRTGDGLVVKRAGRGGDGAWLLVSEHPSWRPAPWPAGAETVGRVVWMARTLV